MRHDEVVRHLDAAGLRPVVDPPDTVFADCPDCDGGASDPAGIWRPLRVIVGNNRVELRCAAGCSPEAVLQAMRAGQTDWQALALETLDIAQGLAALVDQSLLRPRAQKYLKVAA